MEHDLRQQAAQTARDCFKAVETIYRHAYQVLIALKDEIKTEYNLKAESPVYHQAQSSTDPRSWFYHFRCLYLAADKVSLEEYKKHPIPILFLQASFYIPAGMEPILRYGVVKKIEVVGTWKNARFDEYFRELVTELHYDSKSNHIKTFHCRGDARFEEMPLLDLREPGDVVALAKKIKDKYGALLIN